MVIDAHVHISSPDTARFALRPVPPGERRWWQSPFPVEALTAELDRCGVDRAVAVQAFGAYGADSRYVAEAAASAWPRVAAAVGAEPPVGASMEAAAALARSAAVPAVRVLALDPPTGGWLDGGPAEALWTLAGEAGVGLIVCARAEALRRLLPLAEARPDVALVLDDCGVAPLDERGRIDGAHPVWDFAALPHACVKVFSPMLIEAERRGSAPGLLDQMTGSFGADRVAWGSNFPQSGVGDYRVLVDAARAACSRLSATARDAVLGANAERLWFASAR